MFNFLNIGFYLRFVILLLCLGRLGLKGQTEARKDTFKASMITMPIMNYNPETLFGFGLGSVRLFRMGKDSLTKANTHSSLIKFKGIYTLNKQYDIELGTYVFSPNNKYYIEEVLNFLYFPLPFYGLGNETDENISEQYISASYTQNSKLIKKMNAYWYVGLQQQYKHFELEEKVENGLLDDNVPGEDGGNTSGIGIVLRRDDRDNVNATYSGSYFDLEWIHYSKLIGSDFSFDYYLLDYRKFMQFAKDRWTVGGQLRAEFNFGDVPFYKMSRLGGNMNMRGYFMGPYTDQKYLSSQIEFKRILNPYLSLAFFATSGNVFHDFSNLELDHFKASVGTGIRLIPPGTQRLAIRLDVAYGNRLNWYLAVGEAF